LGIQGIVVWLIAGGFAGWRAGMLVRGRTFGPIGNAIVGALGGLIVGWLISHVAHWPAN